MLATQLTELPRPPSWTKGEERGRKGGEEGKARDKRVKDGREEKKKSGRG